MIQLVPGAKVVLTLAEQCPNWCPKEKTVRRINRLSQRQCETAMPTEVAVPLSDTAAVEADVLRVLRQGHRPDNKRSRFKRLGRLGAMATQLENARADGKPVIVKRRTKWLADGLGLWLVCSPSPDDPDGVRRSWIFRWSPGEQVISKTGKARRLQKKVGLGSLLTTDLKRARELAAEMRRLIQDGQDPLLVKRGRAAAQKVAELQLKTLRAAVDEYLLRHGDGWSRKHALTFRHSFRHLDSILDLPVQSLTPNIIVQALSPFWQAHPESARRLRSYLERVIELAVVKGWRAVGQNPAQWDGLLSHHFSPRAHLQPVRHHTALDYRSVASFVAKVRATQGVVARALQLLILTGVRTSEVVFAKGEEFDLDVANPTWTVPWQRTKSGKKTQRPHIVPLSDSAVACLENVGVVPGQRVFPCHDRSVYRLAKRLAGQPITAHGFRSCFATFAAEQTDYPSEIHRAALDHLVGDDVIRRYARTTWIDKRRSLLADWSRWCDGKAEASDNVVPMAAASARG
jgi:integrase